MIIIFTNWYRNGSFCTRGKYVGAVHPVTQVRSVSGAKPNKTVRHIGLVDCWLLTAGAAARK